MIIKQQDSIKVNIMKIFKKEEIAEPPYNYEFLTNLNESEYPEYLKKIFKNSTGRELNLKHPKTFNEKIQWLKLYDTTPLKTRLTDKILVRDWIKDKIGEEYLKPVLWIGDKYDDIPFEILPACFFIKLNHGCKWHFVIKKKDEFLNNEVLINIVKNHITGWLGQSFFPYAGFEMQYKDIEPKILIEPILADNINEKPHEIEIYCFNGVPEIFQKIRYSEPREVSIFDKEYKHINLKFLPSYKLVQEEADENLRLAAELSKELCRGFKLVRIDWLINQNRLYFNEMTYTPFSGFYKFNDEKWNKKLGNMLDLRKD